MSDVVREPTLSSSAPSPSGGGGNRVASRWAGRRSRTPNLYQPRVPGVSHPYLIHIGREANAIGTSPSNNCSATERNPPAIRDNADHVSPVSASAFAIGFLPSLRIVEIESISSPVIKLAISAIGLPVIHAISSGRLDCHAPSQLAIGVQSKLRSQKTSRWRFAISLNSGDILSSRPGGRCRARSPARNVNQKS